MHPSIRGLPIRNHTPLGDCPSISGYVILTRSLTSPSLRFERKHTIPINFSLQQRAQNPELPVSQLNIPPLISYTDKPVL